MKRLYELRIEKGLSQRDIAKVLHVSQATYNNWENGKTEPSIAQLVDLSKYFEVSIDYLTENADELGIINYGTGVSEYQKNLLDNFDKLPASIQNNLYEFLQNINRLSKFSS